MKRKIIAILLITTMIVTPIASFSGEVDHSKYIIDYKDDEVDYKDYIKKVDSFMSRMRTLFWETHDVYINTNSRAVEAALEPVLDELSAIYEEWQDLYGEMFPSPYRNYTPPTKTY